ncbi:hypothetical protein LguiB_005713 [Lonicera macranthoides]
MAEESKTNTSTTEQSSSLKSSQTTLNQSQEPQFNGLGKGAIQTFPIMYPAALVPGLFPLQQDHDQDQNQMNRGAGIYAVPTLPFNGPIAGFPSNTLIPFTYNVPTGTSSSSEAGAVGGVQGLVGQQQQQQQQIGPQRQVVVRRFQIAIHLDLLLILKLAAVIFLFNQDGSRQRLVLLIFFATLVYLYQTGALAPLVRWLSQGMQRAARPAQPPRPPAVRADNVPPPAAAVADGQGGDAGGGENEGNRNGVENEDEQRQAQGGGNRWWGIVKEVQMIVFGFITSLLPGFHNLE